MSEPEGLVVHLLREMREETRQLSAKMNGVSADLRSNMQSLRADVGSDLLTLEKRMNDQFIALRRSVMEYHSTAEERVRGIESRLEMRPPAPL